MIQSVLLNRIAFSSNNREFVTKGRQKTRLGRQRQADNPLSLDLDIKHAHMSPWVTAQQRA